jgi:macrolide transport system ATP-binding/permease protein
MRSAVFLSCGAAPGGILYNTKPFDIPIFAIATSVLVGTAVMAAYVPVRRAASLDPVRALRLE